MHVRERGTRGRALRTSTSYPEKPVVQPWGFGTRWLSPFKPYPIGGPGKHSRHGAWPQLRGEHPQWEDDSSTNATSPCLLPRHVRQRLWPSPSARQRPHPETHGWHKTQLVFIKTQRQVCQMQRRECSFREKTLLACWSAQGRWSSATQTEGSAAWCVQSTRHGKNHHRCSAIPPARESSEECAQLVEFTRSAEVKSRTM